MLKTDGYVVWDQFKKEVQKLFHGEMSIRTIIPTTLLKKVCKIFLNSQVISKRAIDPGDKFLKNS